MSGQNTVVRNITDMQFRRIKISKVGWIRFGLKSQKMKTSTVKN